MYDTGPDDRGNRSSAKYTPFWARLALVSFVGWGAPSGVLRMLVNWCQITRLETRTKESNICASIWVENHECAMKVKEVVWASEVGPWTLVVQAHH